MPGPDGIAVDASHAVDVALEAGAAMVAGGQDEFAYAMYHGLYIGHEGTLPPDQKAVLKLRLCEIALRLVGRRGGQGGGQPGGSNYLRVLREHIAVLMQLDAEYCLPPDLLLHTAAVRVRTLIATGSPAELPEVLRLLRAAAEDAETFHRPRWTRHFKTLLAVYLLLDLHHTVAMGRARTPQRTTADPLRSGLLQFSGGGGPAALDALAPRLSHLSQAPGGDDESLLNMGPHALGLGRVDDDDVDGGATQAEQLLDAIRRGVAAVNALLPPPDTADARVAGRKRGRGRGYDQERKRRRRHGHGDLGDLALLDELDSDDAGGTTSEDADGSTAAEEDEEQEESEESQDGGCGRRRARTRRPLDAIAPVMAAALRAVVQRYEALLPDAAGEGAAPHATATTARQRRRQQEELLRDEKMARARSSLPVLGNTWVRKLAKGARVEARDDDGVWYPGVIVQTTRETGYHVLFDGDADTRRVSFNDVRGVGRPPARASTASAAPRMSTASAVSVRGGEPFAVYEDGAQWARVGLPQAGDGGCRDDASPPSSSTAHAGGLAVLSRVARLATGSRRVRGGAIAERSVLARDARPSRLLADATEGPAEVGLLLTAAIVAAAGLDVAKSVALLHRAARRTVACDARGIAPLIHLAAYPALLLSGAPTAAWQHLALAAAASNAVIRRTAAACRVCVAPVCAAGAGATAAPPSLPRAWAAFVRCCEEQDAAGLGELRVPAAPVAATPSPRVGADAEEGAPVEALPPAEGWGGFFRVYAAAVAVSHGVTPPAALCPPGVPPLYDPHGDAAGEEEALQAPPLPDREGPAATPVAAHRALWASLRAGAAAADEEARYRARVARDIAAAPTLREAVVSADIDRTHPQQDAPAVPTTRAAEEDVTALAMWVPGGRQYFQDT